jgi:hypothetical protein
MNELNDYTFARQYRRLSAREGFSWGALVRRWVGSSGPVETRPRFQYRPAVIPAPGKTAGEDHSASAQLKDAASAPTMRVRVSGQPRRGQYRRKRDIKAQRRVDSR